MVREEGGEIFFRDSSHVLFIKCDHGEFDQVRLSLN